MSIFQKLILSKHLKNLDKQKVRTCIFILQNKKQAHKEIFTTK